VSRQASVAHFKAEVRRWAERLRVKPKQIRVQIMTRKWGSCSAAGRVSFAVALIRRPASFRRFVIVHELLHLRVPNHGRLFKAYLTAYQPRWRRVAAAAHRPPRLRA
jgi:predicted metal-dependent hydrolase